MMEEIKKESVMRKWNWQSRCYIGFLITDSVILVNWLAEVIRFESPMANYIVMLIGLSLSIALIPLSFGLKGWKFKIIGAVFSLPLIVLSLLLGLFSCIMLTDIWNTGSDPSFERIESVRLAHSRVTVYRTNGGAMTSFGVVLRQEKTLLPGVLLVRRVKSFYPALKAKISVLGKNTVQVVVAPYCPNQSEQKVTCTLKRWVYI